MYRLYIKKNISSKELLKEVLEKYHIKYDIFYNEFGKPYLKNNELFFNISHSGEYTVLVTSEEEIGVDIQAIKPYLHLIDRVCTVNEQNLIKTPEDFTKMWVKKESYVKKLGRGIDYGLRNVDTTQIVNYDIYRIDNYYIAVCY